MTRGAPNERVAHQVQLALQYARAGKYQQALATAQRVLSRTPGDPTANNIAASILVATGQPERALFHAQRAAAGAPHVAAFSSTLGNACSAMLKDAEAVEAYRQAIQTDPDYGPAYIGLCAALCNIGRAAEGVRAGRRAVELDPARGEGPANLASALLETGSVEECISVLREAIGRHPADPRLLSQLAIALNYSDRAAPEDVFEVHRAHAGLISPPEPAPPSSLAQRRDENRALRVGYISADFRTHSVAYFVEPIITHHDHDRFEVYCYATSPKADATTSRLQEHADVWRDVHTTSDQALLKRLRNDQLDVLVDLAGLTPGNKLRVLAHRAAPVQISYCGYPNTTGLPAMDLRLVDAITDTPQSDAWHTETLERLAPCFLCYRPPDDAPEPALPPCRSTGCVTFGSFNALPKLSDACVALWSRVLAAVPMSRLILKNRNLGEEAVADRCRARFAERGIDPSRIVTIAYTPTPREHLELYSRIDIALDTYPYHGTATTCEALFMGVPVVTLAGRSHAARVGASLLSAADLGELVADTEDAFVETAVALAGDAHRLAERRKTMRARLAGSPLGTPGPFVRGLEHTYRNALSRVLS